MTVPVRWSREAEKREWMLGHAGGRPIEEVREDFEAEFGHPITGPQVSFFRAEYGLGRRRANRTAHREVPPVGAERVSHGYVYVKVRELPSAPQSKDNWVSKARLVWESTRGLRLPDGWAVLFCDRDARNFDPANLKAVPRDLMGVINAGPRWAGREGLEAAIALAMVRRAASEAGRGPVRCGVCGREFVPEFGRAGARQVTCRECLDRGLHARRDYGTRTCPECGRTFEAHSAPHRFCSKECRRAAGRRRHAG